MRILRLLLTTLLAFSLTGISGCIPSDPSQWEYRGDYVDLMSEIRSSIVGVDNDFESHIYIVEEDAFGRKLFGFVGSAFAAASTSDSGELNGALSILISQKTEDDYVYYYPDVNFILYKPAKGLTPDKLVIYAKEDIEQLKLENDWDKPLDESKCFKVRIEVSVK